MEFKTLYELLLAVRDHKLEKGESFLPLSHVTGSELGYVVADSKTGPALCWRITRKLARTTSTAPNEESRHIWELASSYMGRKKLLKELPKLNLEALLEVPVEEPPRQLEFSGLQ